MISPRILRRRIRSIESTAKITKAMEMIAAAKMRRAQEQALAGRPYDEKIRQVIGHLAIQPQVETIHPLLARRETKRIAVIFITTDRGLCGGLNANMNRLVGNFILEQTVPVTLVTVGRKGRDFMIRAGREVRAEFTDLPDRPKLIDTMGIARVVIDDYTTAYADLVYLAYPRFVTTMVQQPVLQPLLPVQPAFGAAKKETTGEYLYEPDPRFVLGALLPRFVQMEVYHAILEAIASEQSARMVAMRNATDNARELIQDLTIALNKARQETITKELLDITTGAEALVTRKED